LSGTCVWAAGAEPSSGSQPPSDRPLARCPSAASSTDARDQQIESENAIRYDSYDAAIIAAICQMVQGKDALDDASVHLKAILDKHPNLVNARRVFQQPHKPGAEDGFTPLHFAARYGDERVVALLLEKGADVRGDTGDGWTALHLAAERGQLPIVKLLVEHGANTNAKTDPVPQMSSDELPGQPPRSPGEQRPAATIFPAVPARTALDLAREQKHGDVVDYLQSVAK
jgi:hypothetical protein